MPVLQLDSLLGRARDGDDPVFPLVRRRVPSLTAELGRQAGLSAATVSIVLLVALVLGTAILAILR